MNKRHSVFFDDAGISKPFPDVLTEVQEYITAKFSTLISDNPEEQKKQICAYIAKYLTDYNISVKGFDFDGLIERLFVEMVEFSFLTPYLSSKEIEEININSWDDVKITLSSGEIIPASEHFNSPQHAVDVIRRLLHQSGMVLDHSQPIVRGHLSNKIRITVLGNPVTDEEKGIAASIRIVNPKKLGKKDFIKYKTATAEMLDFLTVCLRYGLSMCVTGATGSGKTTVMSWLLSTIPDHMRIFTIENGCREFDLVKRDEHGNIINNVVHTCTRCSEDSKQDVTQDKLLETGMTMNPDYVVVAEMKSSEAHSAVEAALTGHAVITTIHANSCEATYYRMVTLCKKKQDMNEKTVYSLVTEAFPIVMFAKKLEDNSRRIMEITECEILPNGERKLRTLFRYNITENSISKGKVTIKGEFERVNPISENLQKRLRENGMPISALEKLVGGDAA